MIKTIGIAICVLLCSLFVKNYNKTFAVILSIFGGITIFILVSDKVEDIMLSLLDLSENISTAFEYIKLMIKVLGITLISQFVSDICKDSGEIALSSVVLLCAKIVVISMILPLFETVINIVIGLVE